MADDLTPTNSETLFEFPCTFPIKVMGEKTENLKKIVYEILLAHLADADHETIFINERESTGGKYLSITAKFKADSKDQLNAIYQALSNHEAVKMVL